MRAGGGDVVVFPVSEKKKVRIITTRFAAMLPTAAAIEYDWRLSA